MQPEIDRTVQRTCSGCDAYEAGDGSCAIATEETEISEALTKSCDPPGYLRRALRAYIGRKRGPIYADRADDIASDCVTRLLKGAAVGVPSGKRRPGLRELRAGLFGFAIQCYVDGNRRVEGKYRCGNCANYVSSSNICGLSAGDHPHGGRRLDPRQNPRQLEPACQSFTNRRATVSLDGDAGVRITPRALENPEDEVRKKEGKEILVDALAEIQKEMPENYLVLQMKHIQNMSLEAIAADLNLAVRTVSRRKKRAEKALRKLLESQGVSRVGDLT